MLFGKVFCISATAFKLKQSPRLYWYHILPPLLEDQVEVEIPAMMVFSSHAI